MVKRAATDTPKELTDAALESVPKGAEVPVVRRHRVSRIAAAFPGRHRRDQPERTNARCARDAVLMPSEVTP